MKRLCALLLALGLCLGVSAAASASAADAEPVRVYVDGLLRLRGYRAEGILWLCPEDLCTLFGVTADAETASDAYRLTLPQGTLEAPADTEVYTLDGRFFYCPEGRREIAGRSYFPADLSLRLFGLTAEYDADAVQLDTSAFRLLRGGQDYYAVHFPHDDLFWLSHIIFAEVGSEPLAAKIGVGSVVLNRVKNELFPSSVMEVVLDATGVQQFDPVGSGRVGNVPDEESLLAACLCLEGYDTVGDSLYFVNPELTDTSWFDAALTPVVTIGNCAFYA